MKQKVLVLGYIPKFRGGKQKSGLATGIFDLHNAVNKLENEFEVIIAATDIHQEKVKIDNTQVIGWNKKILTKYILRSPGKTLGFLFKSFSYMKFRKITSPLNLFFKLIFFDYAISIVNPDILHFHGVFGALVSKGFNADKHKKLLRLHGINGFDESIKNSNTYRKLENYITSLSFDKVSFVTDNILNEWRNNYGNFHCEMVSILNGFDNQIFKINEEKNFKKYDLITFSGISSRKGQERVIDALINLNKKNISLSYLIIGEGDKNLIIKLKEKVEESRVNVEFLDYLPQKDIVKYLWESNFFILPSTTEGFGKVFIESIAAGVPVIIPSHIPLCKEPNILSDINTVFLNDYTTKSIEKGIQRMLNENKSYDKETVSNSVAHLNWNYLAEEYSEIVYAKL